MMPPWTETRPCTGLTKRQFLEQQYGARGGAAMRSVKDALDPDGILNPGKVLPD